MKKPMKRIKLIVAYDGTNYAGWQKQQNANTIQAELESVCYKYFKQKVRVDGSGRTDTGVHADGQVAVFHVSTDIGIEKIPYLFNSSLPKDIVVKKAGPVSERFHPTLDVKEKIYEYTILNAKLRDVRLARYAYFVYRDLQIEEMIEASKHFLGEHDFKAFCSADNQTKTTIRTISNIEFKIKKTREGKVIRIRVSGTGFLHNMVRIIIGTLIEIGYGKKTAENIVEAFATGRRGYAGFTAPAHGLCLKKVQY